MHYDGLTPRQKMALPQLVAMSKRTGRPGSWRGNIAGREGIWSNSHMTIEIALPELSGLKDAGFITLEIHENRQHALVTVDDVAYAAVEERFGLTPEDYLLHAAFVAGESSPDGYTFAKHDAERYAQLPREEFDREWSSALKKNLIVEWENVGQMMICCLERIAVGRIKLMKDKPIKHTSGDTFNIIDSPNSTLIKGDNNKTSIHQSSSQSVKHLIADIDKHRHELNCLSPTDKEDANHSLDELSTAIHSGKPEKTTVRTSIRTIVTLAPGAVKLIGVLKATCTFLGMTYDEIKGLFGH
jgi:hypothetical protein